MSNLKLDNKTVSSLEDLWIKKIKVFFYDSGCSWTKVNIESDFEITIELVKIDSNYSFEIYVDKRDEEKFENCSITKTVTADHTGKEKVRYIYASQKVKSRCWCWSSFDFWEKKVPKLDLSKFKDFKNNFKK